MTEKSIEIFYNIADIPDITDKSGFSLEALDFRNAAMEHIEAVLTKHDAGEWEGAEIGASEVNFGFIVKDFDEAEALVRAAVEGTRFAAIRDIARSEFNAEDFEDFATPRPMNFLELIGLLIFKRLPKRFRQT